MQVREFENLQKHKEKNKVMLTNDIYSTHSAYFHTANI